MKSKSKSKTKRQTRGPRVRRWDLAPILQELIDDNPFAVRALLQIVSIKETTEIPTLAVTLGESPRLLVNPEFIGIHCHTEQHLKAVICHEFLHVLLRHTERLDAPTPANNLAFDAVINAIIHRALGPDYSDMMSRYYENQQGLGRLLRPPPPTAVADRGDAVDCAWHGLYAGTLVADDIHALAEELAASGQRLPREECYLGNHAEGHRKPLSGPVADAIDRALQSMNGHGIFRAPRERGIGADPYEEVFSPAIDKLEGWRRETLAVLRRHVVPGPSAVRQFEQSAEALLPVLSPSHRRSFLRALWSPFVPEAVWPATRSIPRHCTNVYLDVSGSMYAEMPLIVSLLGQVASHIRRPFWAFSDKVAPARIRDGKLVTETTGGTSMQCVLDHLAKHAPPCAVVITDGYIEPLGPEALAPCKKTRLHALVTRDGRPQTLRAAGVPYTQLSKVPR